MRVDGFLSTAEKLERSKQSTMLRAPNQGGAAVA